MLRPSVWNRRRQTHPPIELDHIRKSRRCKSTLIPHLEALEARIVLSNWSGPLTSNTTFVNTEVQNIVGAVDVEPGVTLTIQPGTVVQFNGGTSLTVDGTLLAQGTTGDKIVFTSVNDNSAEGGSNTAAAGDWVGIQFNSDSSGNVVTDAEIKYGGAYGNPEILATSVSPTIENSTIASSGGYGVQLVGSDAVLTGDTFLNDGLPDGDGASTWTRPRNRY